MSEDKNYKLEAKSDETGESAIFPEIVMVGEKAAASTVEFHNKVSEEYGDGLTYSAVAEEDVE